MAFVGFALAYRFDYPVGPSDIALLGAVYGLCAAVKRLI